MNEESRTARSAGFLVAAAGSLALKVGSVALALATSSLLARLLGPDGFGLYTYVISVVTILALPAQFGLPTLLTRQLAGYSAANDWGLARGIVRFAVKISLVASVFVLSASWLIELWYGGAQGDQGRVWRLALLLLPLIAAGSVFGAGLQGLGKILRGQLPEMLIRPGALVLGIALWVVGRHVRGLNASQAMLVHVLGGLASALIAATMFFRALPKELSCAQAVVRNSEWLRSIVPLSMLGGIQVLSNQADILVLGHFRPIAEIGVYRVATQSAGLVAFVLAAVNMPLAPMISRLYVRREFDKLQDVLTRAARVVLIAAIPLSLILAGFGGQILALVFGKEFRAGGSALAILCVGQLVNAGAGSVATLLNMTGHERDTMMGLLLSAIASLVLNVILVPRFGLLGAALSSAAGLALWNIGLCVVAMERLGLHTTAIRLLPRISAE